MESIWVPIAIALFGNGVAVAIVILTNRAAVAREQSRQAHEANRWLREDRWRVSEVQRDYYVSFYREIRSASLAVHNAGYKIGPPLGDGWQLPAYGALVNLRVFANQDAYAAAELTYSTLWTWGDSREGGYETVHEVILDAALRDYINAVRVEIGLDSASQFETAGQTHDRTSEVSEHDHTPGYLWNAPRSGDRVETSNKREAICPVCGTFITAKSSVKTSSGIRVCRACDPSLSGA